MRTFRQLNPFESWRLSEHLLRLGAEDRQLRFCGSVGDTYILAHCDKIDWLRAVIIGFFEDGVLRGAAELQLETGVPGRAELAVTVEPQWRDLGIGTELLRYAITLAGNRAMRSLYMICLLDNHRMQHIARKFTDRLTVREDEAEADLTVPFPTHVTLWEEAATEGMGLLATVLDNGPLGMLRQILPAASQQTH
jgi:GNAT superfamily N-acetyltransferase